MNSPPPPSKPPAIQEISAREQISQNIRSLRLEQGLSQEALALKADLHRTFIAHVERMQRNISIDNLERIAHALGVHTYQLLKKQIK